MHFWMSNYNHPTPKRTTVVSNSLRIKALSTPKMLPISNPDGVETTRRYRDSSGKQRWQGSKDLKGTQNLTSNDFFHQNL